MGNRMVAYLPGTMPLPHPRSIAAVLLMVAACSTSTGRRAPSPSPSVEAPVLPVASDAAADSLLVDVRSVDSTIRVDLRYATANNFTGAPLPGYEAPRALLRRAAAT